MTDPNVAQRIEAELARLQRDLGSADQRITAKVRTPSAPLIGGAGMAHRVFYGTDAAFLQMGLNLCAAWRAFRRNFASGSPMHRYWHARLKARQLELLILRIGKDVHRMREQGWLEKDPDTGAMHPLERRSLERMLAIRDRLSRARERAATAYRDHQNSRLAQAA